MHNNINDIRVSLIARGSWSIQWRVPIYPSVVRVFTIDAIRVVVVKRAGELNFSQNGNMRYTFETWIACFEKEVFMFWHSRLFNERQWKKRLTHRHCDSNASKKKDDAMWRGNLKLLMTHAVINGISHVTKFIKYKYTVLEPCVVTLFLFLE